MKDNVLESKKIDVVLNQSVRLIGDGFEIIPEIRNANGKTLLYVADQVKMAGFYDVKKGDSTLALIAFNDNRSESDMNYATQKDLEKIFDKKSITFLDSKSASLTSAVIAKNNGTELWKLCLILTLVFIAIEILLIRFYSIHKHINS